MSLFGKEIEYVEFYRNNSNFRLLEANLNWIVYRSEVSIHTTKQHPFLIPTVDLIFVEPAYFELSTYLSAIKVTRPDDSKSLDLAKSFDKGYEYLGKSEEVYKIESIERKFYIVASHLWIHEHSCQFRDSFIENFNYGDYLQTIVKNWIKLN